MIMPSKRDKTYIQVFFIEGEEPFICGADGHVNSEVLDQMTVDFLGDGPEDYDELKSGDYLYQVNWEPDQTGEYGRVEIAGYWNFTEVLFEPLKS